MMKDIFLPKSLLNFKNLGTQKFSLTKWLESSISSGKLDTLPYKYYTVVLTQEDDNTITEGSLIVGRTYKIDNYVAGDDFANVADVISGTINQNDCYFIATGTLPTDWSNSTQVLAIRDTPPTVVLASTIGTINWSFDAVENRYLATLVDITTTNNTIVANPFAGYTTSGIEIINENSIYVDLSSGDPVDFTFELRFYPNV
jgi:hypothetical protein